MKIHLEGPAFSRLCLGSALLGSGGGGNPNTLKPILERTFSGAPPKIELTPIASLPDQCCIAAVGIMGSPELMEDDLPDGTEGIAAIRALESALKRRIDYLIPLEGAGINSIYPLLMAAKTGLPLIDGDGMGRAFPELQMTTLHIYGQKGTPFALINSAGQTILFNDNDNFLLELNTRKTLMKSGGVGYFAGFAMSGREAKESIIPGTISFIMEIGGALEKGEYNKCLADLTEITRNSLYGMAKELFVGTVSEFGHIEPLNLGSLTLSGVKEYKNLTFNVLMQNENVLAYQGDSAQAMVPDLICFLDYSSGLPINNNEATKEMEISVLGIPAPNMLRTRRALQVVGPQSFGYKHAYIPLEQIHYGYYY